MSKALRTSDASHTILAAVGQEHALPLSALVRSPLNVRTFGGADIGELAASILAHGILQNLVVTPERQKKRDTGRYAVVAGGRRLAALHSLRESARITADYPVRCLVVDTAQAIETSLAENTLRESIHPADEYMAFQAMIDGGKTIAEVAQAFGTTVLRIQRRLKLANVAPELMSEFSDNKITLDQLMALAISDDHAAQVAVWTSASPWQRRPEELRARLMEQEIDAATHPLARFVGLAAFEAAGGVVRRDLFSDREDAGYLSDLPLLERLAAEKLQAEAQALASEGWAWTEVRPRLDHAEQAQFDRVRMVRREPTPEEATRLAELEARQDQLTDEYNALQDSDEELTDAEEQQAQALEDAIEEVGETLSDLHDALRVPDAAQRALAGCLVSVDHHGRLSVERGLIRPADRQAALRMRQETGSEADDDAGEPGRSEQAKPELSERLHRQLTAHRTAALQLAIARHPTVGLALLAFELASQVFEVGYRPATTVQIRLTESHPEQEASDVAPSLAGSAFEEERERWADRLPGEPDELLQWALATEVTTLIELVAFCTACTFNDVQSRPAPDSRAIAAHVGQVTQLDMADWWTPTATSYLGSVPKAKILAAVAEACGDEKVQPLKLLKKAALVSAAETALAGKRWLPAVLRRS